MDIITLFCKIDDYFIEQEHQRASQCLPSAKPAETRGHPRRLHPTEVMAITL